MQLNKMKKMNSLKLKQCMNSLQGGTGVEIEKNLDLSPHKSTKNCKTTNKEKDEKYPGF